MLHEIKITEEQYNHIESIRYDLPQKFRYVSKILSPKYKITEETTFITYKDPWHFYLVFECDINEPAKTDETEKKKENDV